MKIRLSLALACFAAVLLPSCGLQNTVVSDTTTTAPDGTVVNAKVTASNSDAALNAGATLASAMAKIRHAPHHPRKIMGMRR